MINYKLVLVFIGGIILFSGLTNAAFTPVATTSNQVSTTDSQKVQGVHVTEAAPTLSNDNYYKNSAGNIVHSPAYSSHGIPSGASAQCRDGTYSFSQSRRGTCSNHGGVASWL